MWVEDSLRIHVGDLLWLFWLKSLAHCLLPECFLNIILNISLNVFPNTYVSFSTSFSTSF